MCMTSTVLFLIYGILGLNTFYMREDDFQDMTNLDSKTMANKDSKTT